MREETRTAVEWEKEEPQKGTWGDLLGVLERHTKALVALTESNRDLVREMREQKEWLMRLKMSVGELVAEYQAKNRR